MRFLVRAKLPVETGNALVKDPNFSKRMDEIMGAIKPEAAYFAAEGGQRTVYFVVNLQDSYQLPSIAEPLWLSLKADVEFIPAMSAPDFAKAAPLIQQATQKFG